ncbi:YcjX family protein [Pseudovibrio exalbescens]|uniref:YcjX family protein n=1 Tax=Pseudovibrio exalbescens TaxID=197461 RepID=UPI000C9B443E|nr:YcjX family protein [Pseudovibrio exalbescens]
MSTFNSFLDDTRTVLEGFADTASDFVTPTVRLGVTGLSRAGKTVFISALVHNLVKGGRLPVFSAAADGRVGRAYLQPQPDDDVPRFDYETHIKTLVERRLWPDSTHQVSELRLTIEYESASFLQRKLGRGKLHLDIVDYPGEWLLDLPLLNQSFRQFSDDALARARRHPEQAQRFLTLLNDTDPIASEDTAEQAAGELAQAFTEYLRNCREDETALSMLPPGRFLMPGDMAGSPALTFAPLDLEKTTAKPRNGSLHAMMERRYEAYRKHVIKPFFQNHFARLDRQIVLVDALQALNAGPDAIDDLNTALGQILNAFRPGKSSWLFSILSRRIDRILFAATKADHLHSDDHDRLEALLRRLVDKAITRAEFAGASVDVLALASVRATRQASVNHEGTTIPALLGTPLPGENLDGTCFDGEEEAAVFPGDFPENPEDLFSDNDEPHNVGLKFIRFRPPKLERTAEGLTLSLPHIRLDRALEFLLGDKLA